MYQYLTVSIKSRHRGIAVAEGKEGLWRSQRAFPPNLLEVNDERYLAVSYGNQARHKTDHVRRPLEIPVEEGDPWRYDERPMKIEPTQCDPTRPPIRFEKSSRRYR